MSQIQTTDPFRQQTVESIEVNNIRGVVTLDAPPESDEETLEIPIHADLEDGVVKSGIFAMNLAGTSDGLGWAMQVIRQAKIEFAGHLEQQGYEVSIAESSK